MESLKAQLNEEVVRVAKYRRMATEIAGLVSAVQAASPRPAVSGLGGSRSGALRSPLSSLGGSSRWGRALAPAQLEGARQPRAAVACAMPCEVPLFSSWLVAAPASAHCY